jgi:hypothetical protein
MDEKRSGRLRFRIRTMLIAVVMLALLLLVTLQQLQIGRQRVEIERLRLELGSAMVNRNRLTDILREQRDKMERLRRANPLQDQP